METNTGTPQNNQTPDRLQELQARHTTACAHSRLATTLWVGMRAVASLVTVGLMAAGIFSVSSMASVLLGLVAAAGISFMLRRGLRILAWLGLAGGVASLVLLGVNLASYLALTPQLPLLWLYIVVAVADALIQAGTNGWLLADKAYREFARDVSAAARS